jgi:hypothetical protein
MSSMYPDTHPKMERMQIEFIRRMPSWKKFTVVDGLNETVKTLAMSGLRAHYPQAGEAELHRRLAGLLLGEELARKVYGDIEDAA